LIKLIFSVLLSVLLQIPVWGMSFDLPAAAYTVIDLNSEEVLDSKNADVPMPMASVTKIMTCILALEHLNLADTVTVDPEWVKVEGSSLGLLGGHTLTVKDLLIGMMLKSGNDAANCVAYLVSGSIDAFCDQMDQKAAELGMYSTDFESPSGLPNTKHHSTVNDMAKLTIYALNNESFADICSRSSAKITVSGEIWTVHNTNKLLTSFEGAIGVKTGYTDAAGRCLISAVRREEGAYLCVTFNMSDHFAYHQKVYETIFSTLPSESYELKKSEYRVSVTGGISDTVKVIAPDTAFLYRQKPEVVDTYIPALLYAPIQEGQVIGWQHYSLGDSGQVFTRQIVAAETIQARPEKSLVEKVLSFFKKD